MNLPIRVGKVSAIDFENGMVQVTYKDLGKTVTKKLPYMNFNNEYNMPRIGEQVLTAHLSNGNSKGVVIGPMWDKANQPAETGKNIYRKDLSKTKGAAYVKYDDEEGIYIIQAGSVKIIAMEKAVIDGSELQLGANISIKIEAPAIDMETEEYGFASPKVTIGKTSGEGKSLSEMEIDNQCDIKFSSEDKFIEAKIKKVVLETMEEFGIKSATDICLEDSSWKTTLNKIMTRLGNLDGDQSDKK